MSLATPKAELAESNGGWVSVLFRMIAGIDPTARRSALIVSWILVIRAGSKAMRPPGEEIRMSDRLEIADQFVNAAVVVAGLATVVFVVWALGMLAGFW